MSRIGQTDEGKVHTAFQRPLWTLWTMGGYTSGIISSVPVQFGPEKAKRLRSSVFLRLWKCVHIFIRTQYGSRSIIKTRQPGCNQKWYAYHFSGIYHFWVDGAKVTRRAVDGVFRWCYTISMEGKGYE